MTRDYIAYLDLIAKDLSNYEQKSTDELKNIIKNYPDYTSADMAKLEQLKIEDAKILDTEEHKKSTLKIHLEEFKRSRDINRDNAMDDLFPDHDRAHAIRAVACDLIIKYLEGKLA